MADDDEQYEEEEEIEAEEAPKLRTPRTRTPEPDEGGRAKTEAELAMLAQKRKQDEDDQAKLAQFEEQRRMQREKDEEELRLLKEKQERRRLEREEEERIMAERRQEEEERRRQEDEERKAKLEEIKRKKEEEKRKRQEMIGLVVGPLDIPQKKDKGQEKFDKFGNIVKAKAEMGLTKEQHQDQKRRALADIIKPIDFASMDPQTLKSKLKEMHQRLCRLEGNKYDLEERRTRQEYDLKELNERQRQIARGKALKKGLNADQIETGPHPPKISVISKYDRQIDRRNFNERRAIYDTAKAVPHFPNVPPMPQELVKEIKGEKTSRRGTVGSLNVGEDGGGEEEEYVEEEEEEEE